MSLFTGTMQGGAELAFPFVETGAMQGESINLGLTKRELFAAMAMQGMLAQVDSKSSPSTWDSAPEGAARASVRCADALLAELAKPQEPTP